MASAPKGFGAHPSGAFLSDISIKSHPSLDRVPLATQNFGALMPFPAPQMRKPANELGPRAQQTQAMLLDTARSVFLEKGYGGTRIDDIADAAGISRASFYTYFPSKRDALLAAGTESAAAAQKVLAKLDEIPADWSRADISSWVAAWIEFLDVHGAFVLVWGQAGYEDKEIRLAGVHAQLRNAKRLATTLIRLGHPEPVHSVADSLALIGMIERLWYYHYVADGVMDADEMHDSIVRMVVSLLGGEPQPRRNGSRKAR